MLKKSGLARKILLGVFCVGGLKLLSYPLGLLSSVIIARALEPSNYGHYAFITTIITLLSLPVGTGIVQLITREVASCAQKSDFLLLRKLLAWARRWVSYISVGIIVCILPLIAYNAEWTSGDRWSLLLIALMQIPLMAYKSVNASTLRGLGLPAQAQFSDVFVRPLALLCIAALLLKLNHLTLSNAIWGQSMAVFIAYLVSRFLFIKHKPTDSSGEGGEECDEKRWLKAWFPFTLMMASSVLNANVGILFLGWLSESDEVGAFRIASQWALVVSMSLSVVNYVISPHITAIHQKGDSVAFKKLFKNALRGALLIASPVAAFLIFFGATFLEVAYGDEYVALTSLPLAILAAGQLVNVSFGSCGLFLTMSGYETDTLKGQLVSVFFNLIIAAILIPWYGALGAAVAAACGVICWNVILAFKFRGKFNFWPVCI